jgi:RNA polymerase sigma-70 factor (sigma-E family)
MGSDRIDQCADFTAFAGACQLRMLRAAYLVCGDRHLAEDLLQGALIKVALRWGQLRDGNPEAYLRVILFRDAVSWRRRMRREVSVADPPDRPGVGHRAPDQAPDDGNEPTQRRILFAVALGRLTAKQRAILVLRYFEDHTEVRTAEILGVSVGTVKSQTAVALRRLRELAPELSELVHHDDRGGSR